MAETWRKWRIILMIRVHDSFVAWGERMKNIEFLLKSTFFYVIWFTYLKQNLTCKMQMTLVLKCMTWCYAYLPAWKLQQFLRFQYTTSLEKKWKMGQTGWLLYSNICYCCVVMLHYFIQTLIRCLNCLCSPFYQTVGGPV